MAKQRRPARSPLTRRRALLAAAILLWLGAPMLVRPPAVAAGTCPTDPAGALEKSSYQLGERLDFWGNYTDFAAPGTVTIRFTRPADGAVRTFPAFNVADGSWTRTVVFSSRADLGAWRVRVEVVQASGSNACDDRFTLVAANPRPIPTPPNTDTAGFAPANKNSTVPLMVIVIGLIAFLIALRLPHLRR